MHVGVCITIVIMILLIASIIWLSIRKYMNERTSIKEFGGSAETDVCKCDGSVAVIYWIPENERNILYVKVGYKALPEYSTPKSPTYLYVIDDGSGMPPFSSPEFYHGNIRRWFKDGIHHFKGVDNWYFKFAGGQTIYPTSGVRGNPPTISFDTLIGSAGVAEILVRFYILRKLLTENGVSAGITQIQYGSNKTFPSTDNISWRDFYDVRSSGTYQLWGTSSATSGELFRFIFATDVPKEAIITINQAILELRELFGTNTNTAGTTDDDLQKVLREWVDWLGSKGVNFQTYIKNELYTKTFGTIPTQVKCSWKPWCSSCEQVDIPKK